ncbi:MAG: RdgB/HAM1 family non-canonical purine NTP pyrophosphatase [Acidobacteria bacterium]|nr:RdgB/HAM1 family non-canonical purine NTP pyrophosphatase [Acidobacteriota bacterium]
MAPRGPAGPPRRTGRPPGVRRPRPIAVFVATRNPAKLRELEQLLAGTRLKPYGPDFIGRLPAAVEDAPTFEGNARKKALQYSAHLRSFRSHRDDLVLADDSGLEIDALDGEPGVRSARLGGPSATDADRVRLVLRRMESVPWERRTARFHCVVAIALARHGEILASFSGVVEGLIAFEPKGSGGFGYDPIFFYPEAGMTFAEMTPEEKDSVSHRGQALERAVGWLRDYQK